MKAVIELMNEAGDPASELGSKIKREVLAGFYPGTEDWTDMIYSRWKQIVDQALSAHPYSV